MMSLCRVQATLCRLTPCACSPFRSTRPRLPSPSQLIALSARPPSMMRRLLPLKVAKSYADAGYFAHNLRAIEVLVDQDMVRSGRAQLNRRTSMISATAIAPTISWSSANIAWPVRSRSLHVEGVHAAGGQDAPVTIAPRDSAWRGGAGDRRRWCRSLRKAPVEADGCADAGRPNAASDWN
jgi:hypothetical protein